MARLTLAEAEVEAQLDAEQTGEAVDVWEHVGGSTPGGNQVATGRLLVRPASKDAPKWGVWRKVSTINPS